MASQCLRKKRTIMPATNPPCCAIPAAATTIKFTGIVALKAQCDAATTKAYLAALKAVLPSESAVGWRLARHGHSACGSRKPGLQSITVGWYAGCVCFHQQCPLIPAHFSLDSWLPCSPASRHRHHFPRPRYPQRQRLPDRHLHPAGRQPAGVGRGPRHPPRHHTLPAGQRRCRVWRSVWALRRQPCLFGQRRGGYWGVELCGHLLLHPDAKGCGRGPAASGAHPSRHIQQGAEEGLARWFPRDHSLAAAHASAACCNMS